MASYVSLQEGSRGRFHTEDKVMRGQSRERFQDAGLEGRTHVATCQERLAALRSWKRQGRDPPLESLEGMQLCQHLFSVWWY